jgi:AraC-like DNA-binding protein
LTLSEHAGRARLEADFPRHDPLWDRALAELIVSGFYRMLMVYGGTQADVHAACFTHAKPAHHQAYSALFGGVERFARPYTGIELDARLLDLPHLHACPELHAFLQLQAERKLVEISRPQTLVERLGAIMRAMKRPSDFTMSSAAGKLGMSVRSLRRRLDEQGATFRDLVDDARRAAAYSMLRDPTTTIHAVSYELGFATPSAFHRAFRRWAGMTPAQYREQRSGIG